MNFKRNIWDKTDVSTFEHTIFFKYSAAYNVVWYAFTVAVLYSVPHIARVSYLCKCMDLGCSVWENVQTLVCKGLCDTHSTGGLISSGLVSKKRRTSSLCEIWGGSRTSAWQTDRQDMKPGDQTPNNRTVIQKHSRLMNIHYTECYFIWNIHKGQW